MALFKLCYVDVGADTDVAGLFAAYRSVLAGLVVEFPGVRFGHVTVPLRARGSGTRPAGGRSFPALESA
ncbi:hypothetical protein [Urbifossiella limnaea]|uniref:Uncharacterized protein n=1 Tax=Urbifossiella limnaea TaxID=2528023 RepID=A0A517Y2Z1_9BACT|nr:hypothetical protein [Urbifossiella limnaea]QDU24186.1 hypothetical protein ETAA1_62000 [Urbifossiella limnaea]